MLYYADKLRTLDPRQTSEEVVETLRRIADSYRDEGSPVGETATLTHPDLVGAAIALGEVHQAVADVLNPERDEVSPELDRLAGAAILLGRCVFRSSRIAIRPLTGTAELSGSAPTRMNGRESTSERAAMRHLLEAATRALSTAAVSLPSDSLQARIPEGYAFYALYPEMYFASLVKLLSGFPGLRSWTAIGIRSIGTSLAAMVAGALTEMGCSARMETVRPRGHPFERRLELGPLLERRLAEDVRRHRGLLVVDEGPGLTCSSFLSVVQSMERIGAEEKVIALLSAWKGMPSIYAASDARSRWEKLRVFHTDVADAFNQWRGLQPFIGQALRGKRLQAGPVLQEVQDLSYGRWRERFYGPDGSAPAVNRATERVKLLLGYDDLVLAKFAGLGRYGQEKLRRATALAEAEFGPPVLGLAYGFLLYRFLTDARPLDLEDLSPAVLDRMAKYYAFLSRHFAMPPGPRFASLAEVILVNSREALGVEAGGFLDLWKSQAVLVDRLPLVQLDGKPQPWEWLRLGSGLASSLLKADGDDHFLDHTVVGEQSILWDLAGACEEWEMDEETRSAFLLRCEQEMADGSAMHLLDFYRAAYLAVQVGAMHYAVHSTDEEDVQATLYRRLWSYSQRLRRLLARASH